MRPSSDTRAEPMSTWTTISSLSPYVRLRRRRSWSDRRRRRLQMTRRLQRRRKPRRRHRSRPRPTPSAPSVRKPRRKRIRSEEDESARDSFSGRAEVAAKLRPCGGIGRRSLCHRVGADEVVEGAGPVFRPRASRAAMGTSSVQERRRWISPSLGPYAALHAAACDAACRIARARDSQYTRLLS